MVEVAGFRSHDIATKEDYPVNIRALFNGAPLNLASDVIRWSFDPGGGGDKIERVSSNPAHFEVEDAAAGTGKWVFLRDEFVANTYDTEVWFEFASSGSRRLVARFPMTFREPQATEFP